jgi:hypothetical protein
MLFIKSLTLELFVVSPTVDHDNGVVILVSSIVVPDSKIISKEFTALDNGLFYYQFFIYRKVIKKRGL